MNSKRRNQTAQAEPSLRLPPPPMTSFHRIQIFVALLAPLTTNVMSQSETPGASATEGFREAKNYIDAAYGVAFLDGGVERLGIPFPGASFRVGRRWFFSETMFLDGEVGLAFPSIGTGKFGVGRLNPNTGKSIALGVRPYPSHLYIQFGTDKGRCDGNVKPRTLRRLNRRGKDVSELLCGETTFSIEGSAWLLYQMVTGDLSTFSQPTYTSSLWSSFMVTWGHRWYLR